MEEKEDNSLFLKDIPFLLAEEGLEKPPARKNFDELSGDHEHPLKKSLSWNGEDILKSSENSSKLKRLPLAITVSENDSWERAFEKLNSLEKKKHYGPVCLVTDRAVDERISEKLRFFRLRKVVILNIDPLEKTSERKLESIQKLSQNRIPVLVNIDVSEIEEVRNEKIDELVERLSEKGAKYIMETGGESKVLEGKLENRSIFTFRNLSCGIINALGLSYDYNMKFSNPEKAECVNCVNFQKCTEYASRENDYSEQEKILDNLGISGDIVHKKNKEEKDCEIYQRCNHHCSDCMLNRGTMIELNGAYSKKFINIMKWITGMEVVSSEEHDGLELTEEEVNLLEKI